MWFRLVTMTTKGAYCSADLFLPMRKIATKQPFIDDIQHEQAMYVVNSHCSHTIPVLVALQHGRTKVQYFLD